MAIKTGPKSRRTLSFLIGTTHPRIGLKLEPMGYGPDEIRRGLQLVSDYTTARLGTKPGIDPTLLGNIDAYENHWFPIVEVVLRTNFPAVHAIVFLNLTQSSGVDVLVTVPTMLDRLELVAKPVDEGGHPDGPAALARLARRGFTPAVMAKGRELVAALSATRTAPTVDPEAIAKAEEALWNWYLEWSGIARVVISERKLLRALGFLRRVRRPDGREEDVLVDDDDLDDSDDLEDEVLVDADLDGTDVTGDDLVDGPSPEPAPADPTPTPADPTPTPEPAR